MFALKGKKVFIYGYNTLFTMIWRNERISNCIGEAGGVMYGFIDRNAGQLPVKALTYDNFKRNENNVKDNYAFILNFCDGLTHVEVAEQLYNDGFINIIFLPFDEKYSWLKAYTMRAYYNQISYGKITGEELLPSYDELLSSDKYEVIKDYGDYISFWLPVSMFDFLNQSECQRMDDKYKIPICSELSVTAFKYYMEMYDYIYDGECGYPETYMINLRNGGNAETVLNNRKQLFQKMEYKLKYDWNYFIDSPILVEFKNHDRLFITLDGLHRTIFLIRHGYEKVPVICDKKSFALYIGESDYGQTFQT